MEIDVVLIYLIAYCTLLNSKYTSNFSLSLFHTFHSFLSVTIVVDVVVVVVDT